MLVCTPLKGLSHLRINQSEGFDFIVSLDFMSRLFKVCEEKLEKNSQ